MRGGAALTLTLVALALGACGGVSDSDSDGAGEPGAQPPHTPAMDEERRSRAPVELSSDSVAIEGELRRELVRAVRHYATSLVAWLYSEREQLDVGPLGRTARSQLRRSPPFVPEQLRGQSAKADLIEIAVQSERGAIVFVRVRDANSAYLIGAQFHRPHERWHAAYLLLEEEPDEH